MGTLAPRCFDDGGHLFHVSRQHDDLRHDLEYGTVLLIDDDIFFFEQKIIFADDGAQLVDMRCRGSL